VEQYKAKKEVSVNGVSQLGSTKLPEEREIRNQMIAGAAEKFTVRYRKTYDNLMVDLACSDELTPGNKLVENSNNVRNRDWDGALRFWEAAKMKKKENEGDRLYNIAVAYEALAFRAFDASGRTEDANPKFDKALEFYQQAMLLDPGEKYIQRAAERLTISKNNLGRAKLHEIFREQEERFREQEEQFSRAEEEEKLLREELRREAMLRPLEDDTAEERNFRAYIHARLSSMAVIADEELENMVDSYGIERFKLDEDQAWRVMDQEIAHKNDIDGYRKEFEFFASKGAITKDDRSALNVLAESFLFLTAEDIQAVESSYKLRN
jgi:tetratricopeptide (TPR) repeat protein